MRYSQFSRLTISAVTSCLLLLLTATLAHADFDWTFGFSTDSEVEPPSCDYSGYLVAPASGDYYVPAGTTIYWVFGARSHGYIYPYTYADGLVTDFPNWEETEPGCFQAKYSEQKGSGEFTEHERWARDAGWYIQDYPNPLWGYQKVTWVGVQQINGPRTVCVGDGATFEGVSDPPFHGDMLEWKTTQDDGTPYSGQGGVFDIVWNRPGYHTVTFSCGTSSLSIGVLVVGLDCEISGCGFGGGSGGGFGGGSGGGLGSGPGGCGSCGAGGIPAANPRWPQVTAAIPADFLGPAPDGGACSTGLQIIECGGTTIAMYSDECGCYQATLQVCWYDEGCTYALGNGITLEQEGDSQNGQNPLTSSYTITDAAGNTIQFAAPLETSGVVRTPLQSLVTDADGRVTTFYRDSAGSGALESVVLPNPNQDTWTYGHEADDTKITSVQAPDGRTTEITYVPSGLAFGEIASIKVYDAPEEPRELITQIDYTYYTEGTSKGRLATAVKNNLEVAYEYSDNKITVIEPTATSSNAMSGTSRSNRTSLNLG